MNLIEIFKAGTRKDANGVEVTITTDDLKQAVANYDVTFHEAPAVIGHPKDNAPAYGWVKRLALEGEVLKAEFDQITPEFAEMVNSGRFKKISASFYLANSPANPKQGSLYLRHVGFLGAMPPAVKGLKTPVFNEADDTDSGIVNFEEPLSIQPTGEPQSMSQSDNQLAELQAKLSAAEKAKADAEAAKAQAEEAKTQAENEAAQLKAEKAAAEQAANEKANADFAEGLVKAGKILPKDQSVVAELLNTQIGTADFSEEGFKGKVKGFLESLPKSFDFHEPVATADKVKPKEADVVQYAEGTPAEAIEMDKSVRAYMAQHSVDYTTAFNAINS